MIAGKMAGHGVGQNQLGGELASLGAHIRHNFKF
jgi:hypothetical protein